MAIQIYQLKDASVDTWVVMDTVTDTMFRPVFFDELQALLWVACIERQTWRDDPSTHANLAANILLWLDEAAPRLPGPRRYSTPGDRQIPEAWAKALVDTSDWDEETLAHSIQIEEWEIVERLQSNDRGTFNFLLEQFGQWQPKKAEART